MVKTYAIVEEANKSEDKVIAVRETVVTESEQRFSIAQVNQDIKMMQAQISALEDAIAKKQALVSEVSAELAEELVVKPAEPIEEPLEEVIE